MSKKFLPLNIPGLVVKERFKRKSIKLDVNKHNLSHFPDKDWKNVWPAPGVFNHFIVPLPLRQGYVKNLEENKGIIPDKYANAELMKIPNFLHLTPSQIKAHCQELIKFKTQWPKGLDSKESIDLHYPIKTIQNTYVRSTMDKRDDRSITASLIVNLDAFKLSDQQKLKLLKLCVGSSPGQEYCNYSWETNELKITSRRCPTYQQNLDFINYTLNVLVNESLKLDKWETEGISESDRVCYNWQQSKELEKILDFGYKLEDVDSNKNLIDYKKAVENLYAKNSLIHTNYYATRPEPYIEKKRHRKMRAIDDVPFEPVYECSDQEKLDAYKSSVKKLFQISV